VITPVQALDELVRQIAVYATAVDDISPVTLLASCQLCRNRLLYLLDTIPAAGDSRCILARLVVLPQDHDGHLRAGSPDARPPQIRWVSP
jgi:hypothetical protein